MKKFLVINPFGIGDVLFTTPVIKAIKNSYPGSFIGYWCNERVKPILKDNPCIDKIFALSRGDIKRIYHQSRWQGITKFLSLLRNIKREHFDISLDFSLDHRYGLTSKLLGIKKRLGYNYKKRGRFLTDKIDIAGYQDKHVVEYYLELLKLLDINPQDEKPELYITEQDKKRAFDLLQSKGIDNKDLVIGIAPGAGESWGKDARLKHWPAEKFARLADRLISELGAKILILGDKTERAIADTIKNTMRNKPIDLAGETNLEELIAIINNLHILVTNDGGPLHIAVALNKKTVSLFGPVDPKVYGPYPFNERLHIVLRRTLDCSPCYRNFRLSRCRSNRECLEKIDVDEVFNAVVNLL